MLKPQNIIFEFIGDDKEKADFNKAVTSYEYISAQAFCQQIGVLCSYLRTPEFTVSYARIGSLFLRSGHSIFDQHKNFLRGPAKDRRPCSLTDEEIYVLEIYINDLYTPAPFSIYPSKAEILDKT